MTRVLKSYLAMQGASNSGCVHGHALICKYYVSLFFITLAFLFTDCLW